MKFRKIVSLRIFIVCLAVSFALAWIVDWLLAIGYWSAWGIIMFAWVVVGISTLFDDEHDGVNTSEKPKDSSGA